MNLNFLNELLQALMSAFTGQIIRATFILIIFTVLKKVVKSLLKKLFLLKIGKLKRTTPESLKQKETIKQLVLNVSSGIINVLTLILIVSVFIPIGSLMASLGAFAFVITFSIQNILGDIVRGFFIIFEEMFLVGDWVQIAGFKGEVLEIGLRTTKLKLFETDEIVLISNNNITTIVKLDIDLLIKEKEASLAREDA
ncbi:MAG: mechanosensitive ion channel family protein [Defluviitaleaceae bacterium]|nr:mechanosensitive ion channel family protein [Defluviitaleaceae bacterium]